MRLIVITEYVLDAHTLVFHLENNSKMGIRAGLILDSPASSLVLPAIALAEAMWIVGKGRTTLNSPQIVLQEVDADFRVKVVPLTRDIVAKTLNMPKNLEMHDRQIIATALWLADQGTAVSLLTKDAAITASGLVPIVW